MVKASEFILLYLEDHIFEQLANQSPLLFSQQGIQENLNLSKSTSSENISKLKKKGLLEERREHVRKTDRFRSFYFLTDEGIQKAKELQEEIGKTTIKVREKDKIREMKISDLIPYLKKTAKKTAEINYTNIIKNITPEGYLDVRTILEPKKYVDYSDKKPEIKYFVGREKEIREINDFLKSKTKILCIKGIAGIGKTTLMSKFLENVEMNVFWHRFSEFTTLRSLATKFGDFLSKIDRRKLENYLKGERFKIEETLIILEEELKGSNVLFVFDDFQKASEETVDFFASFKDLETNVKTIIMGRTIPEFYDGRDTTIRKNIRETDLTGLDKESSIKLLKNRKIKKDLERLYNTTKGHPLMLELITPETKAEAEKFLRDEILKKLKPLEIKALKIASVFRFPFPAKAIVNGTDYDTLDNLVDKSLMERFLDLYDLHDAIREFLYNRLPEKQKIEYHKRISEYYEKEPEEGALLETIYHLLKAKKQKKAATLIVKKGKQLAEKGFSKELSELIRSTSRNQISPARWAEILYVKSLLCKFIGEWDDAILQAKECLKFSKRLDNKRLQGEIYRQLGEILVSRGKYEGGCENLKAALQAFKTINEQQGTAETHYWLGKVGWRTGKLDDAEKHLQTCLNISKKQGDERLRAMAYSDIGVVYKLKGKYKESLELMMKSLEYFKRTDDKYAMSRVQNNIAVTYAYYMNDYRKAGEWYEKCIKTSRDTGIIRYLGYGLANAAGVYAELGEELEKTKKYVDEAFGIFQKLGDKRGVSICHAIYGLIYGIYHKKKNWEKSSEHFENCIKIAEQVEDLEILSVAQLYYGKMLADGGNMKKASEQFKKSIAVFEKLGNKGKVEEVKEELAKLEKN